MTEANLLSGSGVVSDIVIFDSMGKKLQEYDFSEGKLTTYFPTGKIKSLLIAPVGDTGLTYVEYYTNRKIKTRCVRHKESGSNGFTFNQPFWNNPVAEMRFEIGTGWLYQTFYPNGKLYMNEEYTPSPNMKRVTIWYDESGKIDTGARYEISKENPWYLRTGRRLEWWNNTKLKSDEFFKAEKQDDWQRYWFENGKIWMENFYENTDMVISTEHYRNGQLKRYRDEKGAYYDAGLSFYENGFIQGQSNIITSNFDEKGKLTAEYFTFGNFSRSISVTHTTYQGKFNKMRDGAWTATDDKGRPIYSVFYEGGLL
ncbi:MAG TPA: hypothetical protein VKH37_13290, partial [Ferruginibacter sp.]|nr:hypothetical protein [Ferruginibacter sp.]